MPRIVDGLPCINGSTDARDSAMFAGVMAFIGHKDAPDLERYFVNNHPVRHPTEPGANVPEQFSRDQLLCFVAGLHAQCRVIRVQEIYHRAIIAGHKAPNWQNDDGSKKLLGGDFLSPQHMSHLRFCWYREGDTLGYDWLVKDIDFNAKYTPLREPNQLILMCCMAGKLYVQHYVEKTPEWRKAIKDYWFEGHGAWRNEKEIGELLIKKVESYL